jgi:cysteine desulfurase
MKRIYLDHNASTMPLPEVVRAVNDCLLGAYGNPASLHHEGRAARKVMDQARERVAALVHADPEEVYFTGGGSEADALAVHALAWRDSGRRQVITTAIEHRAVLSVCQELEQQGFEVTAVPPCPDGRVAPEAVAAVLTDRTALVAVMLANNDVGALQPVEEIARLAHGCGALVHVDAVQAAGRVAIDFRALGADTLAVSAHKLYGPKGVGAVVVRQRPLPVARAEGLSVLPPVAWSGLRHAGTPNVPGVAGFGVACEHALVRLAQRAGHDRALRDRLESGLCRAFPGVCVNGNREQRLPNTLNVSFEEVDGAALAAALDRCGIAVSTGAACSGGGPSHVLRAMGLSVARITGSLRFSTGELNTEAEVDQTIEAVADALDECRKGG